MLYADVMFGLWMHVKQNTTRGIGYGEVAGLTEALLSAYQDVCAHHAANAQETHPYTDEVPHFIPD